MADAPNILQTIIHMLTQQAQPRPDIVTPGSNGTLENARPYTFAGRVGYAQPPRSSDIETLGLTPQERYLYQMHLGNLAKGGVKNPDGSTSTLRQMTVEANGRAYSIPQVWNNKLLKPEEAVKRAEQIGFDKFPSYATEAEAQKRYNAMHGFLEKDAQPQNVPSAQDLMKRMPMGDNEEGMGLGAAGIEALKQFMPQLTASAAAKWGPSLLAGIGFHGSPYRFDKFDTSKIGTGEGAQSYGHGLYFAENADVAKSYQQFGNWSKANERPPITYKGEPVTFNNMGNVEGDFTPGLKRFLGRVSSKGDPKLALNEASQTLKEMRTSGNFPREQQMLQMEITAAKEAMPHITTSGKIGNLYKVDIPDEHIGNMLDWDKPLSQQPKEVQTKLSNVIQQLKAESEATRRGFDAKLKAVNKPPMEWKSELGGTGKDIYNKVVHWFGTDDNAWKALGKTPHDTANIRSAASEYLAKQGIPGIKYLDQGSRTLPDRIPSMEAVVKRGREGIEYLKARTPANDIKAQDYLKSRIAEVKAQETELAALKETKGTRNFVVFDPAIFKSTARQTEAGWQQTHPPPEQPRVSGGKTFKPGPSAAQLARPGDVPRTEYERMYPALVDAKTGEVIHAMRATGAGGHADLYRQAEAVKGFQPVRAFLDPQTFNVFTEAQLEQIAAQRAARSGVQAWR